MHLRSLRRSSRSRVLRGLLLVFLAWNFLEVLSVRSKLQSSKSLSESGLEIHSQKIFIATTHWNNEAILRSHWNDAVVALAKHFGPENVYVSVYESGSWDNTKDALRLLDQELGDLGVQRTIILDETTHVDEITKPPASSGWIDTPKGTKELRRIPYLAGLRNLSLKPLEDLATIGLHFDKILFLNDVVFKTQDVLNLLKTNDGVYAAACALDFSKAPKYYDTFALRDASGQEPVMQVWPYFRSRRSRSALKSGVPIPVESCWNGMVFMDASPFYSSSDPLRFRGIPDSLAKQHLEGSECCLIHADNPLSHAQGVWINPHVRVGYNGPAYEAVNPDQGIWLSSSELLIGLWKNRIWRWTSTNLFKGLTVDRRIRAWESTDPARHELGPHCLINEMQVLVSNGWAHV